MYLPMKYLLSMARVVAATLSMLAAYGAMIAPLRHFGIPF